MITSSEPASRKSRSQSDPIAEAARRHFTIPYLYPIQRYVISNILEEKNQIVVLPTGAGKSLCYQLPARIGGGLTVVVVPLLSLLEDQLERCRKAALRADALRGGQSRGKRQGVLHRLRSGQTDLAFITPELLVRLGREGVLAATEIAHLVVDEAHCVSEWGESFRPAYLRIGAVLPHLKVRCLTAFTATASPRILERIQELLFPDQRAAVLSADPDRPNIRYSVIPTLSKSRALLGLVEASPRPLLVFSRTRSGAERAARTVVRRYPDLEVFFYHAGLSPGERERVEAWYKHSRDGILTATSAYGMGVDKADIRTVIHLDVPYSPEAYLQETGRAGRDGGLVQATLLYSQEDLSFAELLGRDRGVETCIDNLNYAAANPGPDEAPVTAALASDRYAQMLGYALDATRCRREHLLGFMGQEPVSCGGCDVCDGHALQRAEGEAEILEFVAGNRRRFTRLQAVKLLRGGKSYEAVTGGLSAFRDFGALAGWQEEEIEEALEALFRSSKIRVLKRGFWRERITTGEAFALKLRN